MTYLNGAIPENKTLEYGDIFGSVDGSVSTYMYIEGGQYIVRTTTHGSPMIWDYADTFGEAQAEFKRHLRAYHV